MKPLIGVLPLWDDEKESLWMLPGYMDGIREAGGLPIMLPLTADRKELEQITEICNGFLLTGGHDVTPELYGEQPLDGLVSSCRARDDMESIILDLALAEDKAVFGICRGIQFLNVELGGTLYQDIPLQRPSRVEHHMTAPYDRVCHKVTVKKGTPLYDLLGIEELGENSYHHQAIKDVSKRVETMAVSEDGLVEAVRMPEKKFVWAVQWHPEFSYKTDENSRKLLNAFVHAAS